DATSGSPESATPLPNEQVGRLQAAGPAESVRLAGAALLVDGKPFFPRGIQWQGEALQFLYERGFNTIQLAARPTMAQSTEAKKLGLWFICPPPLPDTIAQGNLGCADDRVLAWYLDDAVSQVDPDYLLRWAEMVRSRDSVPGRPVVVVPE